MAKELTVTILQESPLSEEQLTSIAQSALSMEGVDDNYELSLVLCDDAFIHDLNRQYRDQDKPTDVLSFPQDQEGEQAPQADRPENLGDIVISVPTAERQAAENNKKVEDEITMLIVHGVLHLLGYDDEYEEDAAEMHARQSEILQELAQHTGK